MNKNTIYYRFLSEKKKYCINFDTTEISIGDIKREIARRRNMEKAPEKYDLLFYDESNTEIRDESHKVEPLKLLIIRRIPSYKLSAQFIEFIHDPSDIALMKGNEYNYAHKTQVAFVNNAEPLEKIAAKISFQQLEEKFKCQLCKRKEEDGYVYIPVLTLCCNETICESCANANANTNVSGNEVLCLICKKEYIGTIPNKSELELKDKLYKILTKLKEEAIQMQLQAYQNAMLNNNNSNGTLIGINNNNSVLNPNSKLDPNGDTNPNGPMFNMTSNNINANQGINNSHIPKKPNISIMPKEQNLLANIQLNPSFPLFEKARFFIIKSSNKENLEISQKHSEWATTMTNQKKLNEAFHNSNVILIFSASRTGCFQGYAIMTTFIGDKVSSLWQNENNVRLGGSFRVVWLSCCEMPFNRVKHLVNPVNGELITKSRDTQELTKEIGYELCTLCYEQEKAEANVKPMKVISTEVVNGINNEIKMNREKQMQRNNPGMIRPQTVINPQYYPFMMGGNYMYPYYSMMAQQGQAQGIGQGPMPVLPTMPTLATMPLMPNIANAMTVPKPIIANTSEKKQKERERSRDRDNSESKSKSKSKSSHSSRSKSRSSKKSKSKSKH